MTIMTFGCSLNSMLLSSSVFIITWHARDIVQGFASLTKLFKCLKKIAGWSKAKLPYRFEFDWKLVHAMLYNIQLQMFVMPYLLIPLAIYVKIDVFYYALPKLLPFSEMMLQVFWDGLRLLFVCILLQFVCLSCVGLHPFISALS